MENFEIKEAQGEGNKKVLEVNKTIEELKEYVDRVRQLIELVEPDRPTTPVKKEQDETFERRTDRMVRKLKGEPTEPDSEEAEEEPQDISCLKSTVEDFFSLKRTNHDHETEAKAEKRPKLNKAVSKKSSLTSPRDSTSKHSEGGASLKRQEVRGGKGRKKIVEAVDPKGLFMKTIINHVKTLLKD